MPDGFGHLARDDPDALRAHQEEAVLLEHRLVLGQPLFDDVHRLTARLGPAGRHVIAHAADLVEAVEQAGPDERFEEVEHQLAFADAVEEDRGAAAERAPHVHAPGAEPQAV